MCIGKLLLFNPFTGPHNTGCGFRTSNLFATWLYAAHLSNILACKNFSVSIGISTIIVTIDRCITQDYKERSIADTQVVGNHGR